MKRLENKTAIVTGGNSGIGKATAILFAKEGADLVLCARRKEALDEVAEECRKYGVQVVTVKADVSSHEDCSAVVKAAVDTFGKVDILVNNAGIVDKHRPITECTDEWWNEIIAIDQSSLFYMMKDTIPHMMASGKGSIINVSSIGGVFGNGGISYSAAKSAALAMTKNVAIQLAPNGIRCNAVCPGPALPVAAQIFMSVPPQCFQPVRGMSSSTKPSGVKGMRSSMPSPTPMNRTGRPRRCLTATTQPPFAVPSSLVRMMPVASAALQNSLA